MVFDDSTAAIDAGTEQRIRSAMRRFAKDRVTLVIAHRLATIRHGDRINVLQNGEMIETGTHDELMAADGLYARLYNMNYASFDDIPDGVVMNQAPVGMVTWPSGPAAGAASILLLHRNRALQGPV